MLVTSLADQRHFGACFWPASFGGILAQNIWGLFVSNYRKDSSVQDLTVIAGISY